MSDAERILRCPRCGESNSPARAHCWLCDGSLSGVEPRTRDAGAPLPSDSLEKTPLVSASLPLTIAVLLVIGGTMVLVPGLGILLAIVLCVPLLRTALVMKRRADRGHVDPFPATAGLFLGSLGVTFALLALVGVTAFGTFCAVCFGTYSTTENIELAMVLSGLVGLAVLVPVCWAGWKWVRRRWKRDVGEEPK